MPGVSETRTYDALLTTTLANYRKKLIDNIADVYPGLSWMFGKLGEALRGSKRLRVLDGGESIVEHVLYEFSSAVKAYSQYETLDTTPQEGMTIARYSWRQYGATIAISGREKRSNMGEAGMIDLLEAKTKQAELSLRNLISTDLWGTNAAGNQLDGLDLVVDSTGTVGGLNQSTFAWWASTETGSGSFAAQGISDMRTLYNTISFGNDAPDACFTTQAVHEFYEDTLQPQARYQSMKAADAGFQNLLFKGIPVLFDRDVASGRLYFLNSEYMNMVVHRDANFSTGKFIEPENQDASVAKILLQANVTTNNRRMHGKLTGITA